MTNTQWAPPTIPSLNGIRAISVLLVVLAHSDITPMVPGGLGVTIFFFLSGYLITTLMLSESDQSGQIHILNFYARRIFRLAPPLLITLLIAYSLTYFNFLPGQITFAGLMAQLLYFANYYIIYFDPTTQTLAGGTGILWSLAVEEHFYIFFPLLMTIFVKHARRCRAISAVLIVLCLIILVWRIHLVSSPGFFNDRTYLASDTRIDSIIFGCLMAFLANPLRTQRQSQQMTSLQWALFLLGGGLLLLSLVFRNPFFRETYRYSIQGIAFFPLFYFAIRYHDNRFFRLLNSRWIVKLGTYSYAIYLVHQIVILAIDRNFASVRGKPLVIFLFVLTISIVYAAAIDSVIDPYFRRIRRRFHSVQTTSFLARPDLREPTSRHA